MSVERLATGYQPDFDIDMAVGRQGELFVADIAQMLRDGSGQVEVKTDERAKETGNLYIEHHCKRSDGWMPSGIATTTADLWAFVIAQRVLTVAPTQAVRAVARAEYERNPRSRRELTRGSHPTRGVVIPIGRFLEQVTREIHGLDESA